MHTLRLLGFLLSTAAIALPVKAQPTTDDKMLGPYFAALTDPACPVSGYAAPAPVTKVIHVLYFPSGQTSTIKQPVSLLLHLVFDYAIGMPGKEQLIPFAKRDDGVWQAEVTLDGIFAVYWVEDPTNKLSDTNGGRYFEVPFCDVYGHRSERSVLSEAQTYTGILTPRGIERSTDYAKAIEILQGYIHPPDRGRNLISSLWRYQLALNRDGSSARAALLAEIDQFIADHSTDGFGLIDALNFVAYEDWIPAQTQEALLKAIETESTDYNARAFLLQARAGSEPDQSRRLALLRGIVEKYPDDPGTNDVRKTLLAAVPDLDERERLYRDICQKDPDDAYVRLTLAQAYLDFGVKLPDALHLVDESEHLFETNQEQLNAKVHYTPSGIELAKRRIALMRADLLVRLGRPAQALVILQPYKNEFTLGCSFYVYGKALDDSGDKRNAVESYLQAAVRASRCQQPASARLAKIWRSEKLGSSKELQRRLESTTAQNFLDAKYTPRLLAHALPDFDLITLAGEHLSNDRLRGKRLILDFWAVWCGPCLGELKALQDFQENHPDVVVLTVVDSSADPKQLKAVIHDRKLASLRVALAPRGLWQQFGTTGVPNTLIIDESGFVRIQHLGAVPDVQRYLDADLQAISAAGTPTKFTPQAALPDNALH